MSLNVLLYGGCGGKKKINQSIIRFVLHDSTTVLMHRTMLLTTCTVKMYVFNKDLKMLAKCPDFVGQIIAEVRCCHRKGMITPKSFGTWNIKCLHITADGCTEVYRGTVLWEFFHDVRIILQPLMHVYNGKILPPVR